MLVKPIFFFFLWTILFLFRVVLDLLPSCLCDTFNFGSFGFPLSLSLSVKDFSRIYSIRTWWNLSVLFAERDTRQIYIHTYLST